MTGPEASSDDTWSDDNPASGRSKETPPPAHQPLVKVNELETKRHEHTASMQKRVLVGVGLLLVITFMTLVIAVTLGSLDKDFALELARMILPPALGSGATIVGVLFVAKNRNEP